MSGPRHFSLGRRLEEVPTPSLVVDLDAFEANCRSIANHLSQRGIDWRPHVKGHKSPALARRMIDAGAIGVTCAKVSEAEEMVAGGIKNVLIANQPSTYEAWLRLARLQRGTSVAAAIDDQRHVEMSGVAGREMNVTIPLVVEVDIGMLRAGVRSTESAVLLARQVIESGGQLAGIMGYEGHLLTIESELEKKRAIGESVGRLVAAAEAIRAASIPVDLVSCGGTGSYEISSEIEGVTEIQAGGGCLMDRFYRESCHVDLAYALFLVASVASRPSDNQAILDTGWKALPDRVASPECFERPGIEISQLYAEHMRVNLAKDENPRIGERIVFLPGYSDATTVLHNEFLGVRNGIVIEIIPLLARGALQ